MSNSIMYCLDARVIYNARNSNTLHIIFVTTMNTFHFVTVPQPSSVGEHKTSIDTPDDLLSQDQHEDSIH